MLKWHDEGRVRWDFVQIQMNYVDWLHAKEINALNTNGEYLYTELEKRGIPAVIMEPLLGGRLSSMPENLTSVMKAARPDDSIASWAFRYRRHPQRHTHSAFRNDLYEPSAGECGDLFTSCAYKRDGRRHASESCDNDAVISARAVQRL